MQQQYTKGQQIEYRCPACGKQVTGTVEGIQYFLKADLVLATCGFCGSTRTIDHLPHRAHVESGRKERTQ